MSKGPLIYYKFLTFLGVGSLSPFRARPKPAILLLLWEVLTPIHVRTTHEVSSNMAGLGHIHTTFVVLGTTAEILNAVCSMALC